MTGIHVENRVEKNEWLSVLLIEIVEIVEMMSMVEILQILIVEKHINCPNGSKKVVHKQSSIRKRNSNVCQVSNMNWEWVKHDEKHFL